MTSWNNLDLNIRNSLDISCFKSIIKENTNKSPGSIKLSIFHARLRHQYSSRNPDLFRITNDPKWQCDAPFEGSINYIMECPFHQNERDCLSRN